MASSARMLLASLLIAALGACQGYSDDNVRTPGEFTDDVYVQAAVKTVLLRDPTVKGFDINVEVKRGEVTLYGPVTSKEARTRAVELARGIRGVTTVQDRLTLVEG